MAVLADEEVEGAETMRLTLSNAAGARLAEAAAAGTVSDPPAVPLPEISIADARVDEGPGAVLEFAVTLDRAAASVVTVDWETRDGSALAGEDYVGSSGTLVFAPGETAKTIRVAVLDDSQDEVSEVMLVVLSNPVGATIAEAAAGGMIDNTDAMPQAWLARFGRTAAEQVLEAVEERTRSAPQAGVQVRLAGHRIGSTAAEDWEAQRRLENLSAWLRGEACGDDVGGACPALTRTESRSLTSGELLMGSSFALTSTAEGTGGGLLSLWGRGALTRFDGRQGDLSLSGELSAALLGADWTRERSMLGVMLSHARGEGSYQGADRGTVASTLIGLYPYGLYALTERLTLWGTAGYGAGPLVLRPARGEALETDMSLMMAVVGMRGTLLAAPSAGGLELTVTTDAMVVQTSSLSVVGGAAGGNLAAATADVTRLRLGLEGRWRAVKIGSGVLTPRFDLGMRHDGGDAETGFGVDVGGGLSWSDPVSGIRLEVNGRGLLSHAADGFRQRGIAGRLGWDPTPASERGPSLTLSQSLGHSAQGGSQALLGRATLANLAPGVDDDELARRRLEMRLGYGFAAFGERFTWRPEFGVGMSAGERDYRLSWRLLRARRVGSQGSLEFAFEARRRDRANSGSVPEHGAGFKVTVGY